MPRRAMQRPATRTVWPSIGTMPASVGGAVGLVGSYVLRIAAIGWVGLRSLRYGSRPELRSAAALSFRSPMMRARVEWSSSEEDMREGDSNRYAGFVL